MSNAPLHAHTLNEARLYLRVVDCRTCGRGPLRSDKIASVQGKRSSLHETNVSCTACGAQWVQVFDIANAGAANTDATMINPTGEPSRILDVGQWLVLSSMMMEEIGRETNKAAARTLGLNAAQCLDEALKFYTDEENDLPAPEAFYCKTSRERFRQSPDQWSRQRIVGMRAKLPHTYTDRQS